MTFILTPQIQTAFKILRKPNNGLQTKLNLLIIQMHEKYLPKGLFFSQIFTRHLITSVYFDYVSR